MEDKKRKRRENEIEKRKRKMKKGRRIGANKEKGHSVDKRKTKEKGKRKRRKGETDGERERGGEERNSTFSLRSTKIGLSVFVGAQVKVDPRNKSYAWVPKSESFVKLQEVENFPTWIISSLKAI